MVHNEPNNWFNARYQSGKGHVGLENANERVTGRCKSDLVPYQEQKKSILAQLETRGIITREDA